VHEWALAEAVVAAVRRIAGEEGFSRVTKVTVALGELQQIESDIFETALRELTPHADERLHGARFHLESEAVLFRCRVCGREWAIAEVTDVLTPDDLEAMHFIPEVAAARIRCPGCSSPDFQVVRGRGVSVLAVTGEG
jgi:hydrogenase nickel incorporation protein HypA/HybF